MPGVFYALNLKTSLCSKEYMKLLPVLDTCITGTQVHTYTHTHTYTLVHPTLPHTQTHAHIQELAMAMSLTGDKLTEIDYTLMR